jgi:divalent metal cation (Fe/Co/Zn/Cd) transporter
MSTTATSFDRVRLTQRGLHLEYITLAWNSLEAVISIVAGVLAGSIALVGFGFDSIVECASGTVLVWRLRSDADAYRRERVEHISLRLVGVRFLALAAYVGYEAVENLLRREAPERSIPGIVLAAASLIVMPVLARAKRKVGQGLTSRAMLADSRQTDLCAYLSAILLAGLLLNAAFGWWWADPVAALVMVPIIVREGVQGLRGESCGCAPEVATSTCGDCHPEERS